MKIEDYGLIGDLQTAALVGRNGSIDWLCLPRFDSASCFSALLGDERHGRWQLASTGEVRSTSRRYRPGTLVLETDFETADGAVRVIDFMLAFGQSGGAASKPVRRAPIHRKDEESSRICRSACHRRRACVLGARPAELPRR